MLRPPRPANPFPTDAVRRCTRPPACRPLGAPCRTPRVMPCTQQNIRKQILSRRSFTTRQAKLEARCMPPRPSTALAIASGLSPPPSPPTPLTFLAAPTTFTRITSNATAADSPWAARGQGQVSSAACGNPSLPTFASAPTIAMHSAPTSPRHFMPYSPATPLQAAAVAAAAAAAASPAAAAAAGAAAEQRSRRGPVRNASVTVPGQAPGLQPPLARESEAHAIRGMPRSALPVEQWLKRLCCATPSARDSLGNELD